MRTNKEKEAFINEMKKRIEIRNTILSFYENVYLPLMCTKFDGKVYNKRFVNALNDEAKKIDPLMSVKGLEYDHIEICLRLNQWNYNDYESMYVPCVLANGGRIDYEATVNNEIGKAWVKNFILYRDEYQQTIDHYDEYMEKANELEKMIKEYNKLPHPFRGNIARWDWCIY